MVGYSIVNITRGSLFHESEFFLQQTVPYASYSTKHMPILIDRIVHNF